MTYIEKLKKEYKDYQVFEAEIDALKNYLQVHNYFQVIILAPQLMEKIVSVIDENHQEYIIRKMGEPDIDSIEIQKLYTKLLQEESIKARVAFNLLDLYENDFTDHPFSIKEFKKYFTKLESVVACRNQLSHEYYSKHISDKKLKRAANEALEIVELISYHPGLSY